MHAGVKLVHIMNVAKEAITTYRRGGAQCRFAHANQDN
jgi:hypothetical protein